MDYTLVFRVKRLRLTNISRDDSVGIGVSFLLFVIFPFLVLGLAFFFEGAV